MSIYIMGVYPCLCFKRGLSVIGCMRTYAYNLASDYIFQSAVFLFLITIMIDLENPYQFTLRKVQKILQFCGDVRKYVSKF